MSLLDAFQRSLKTNGQVDPARVVGGIASAMESYASDQSRALLTHIIVPWALNIARLAPAKWMVPGAVPPSCAFEAADGKSCGGFAVSGCHICGRPICLTHALIAADATLACWACMRLAAKHATPWKPPSPDAAAPDGNLGWAYELLGVEPTVTDAELRTAYRERMKQFHPDRQQGGDSKAHGEMVRLITKAYEEVRSHRAGI